MFYYSSSSDSYGKKEEVQRTLTMMVAGVEPQNNVTNHMDTESDDSDDEGEESLEDTEDEDSKFDYSDDLVPLY